MKCSDDVVTSIYFKYGYIGILSKQQCNWRLSENKRNKIVVETLIVNTQSGDQMAPTLCCCCCWCSCFCALDAMADDSEGGNTIKYLSQNQNIFSDEKVRVLVRYLHIHTRKCWLTKKSTSKQDTNQNFYKVRTPINVRFCNIFCGTRLRGYIKCCPYQSLIFEGG